MALLVLFDNYSFFHINLFVFLRQSVCVSVRPSFIRRKSDLLSCIVIDRERERESEQERDRESEREITGCFFSNTNKVHRCNIISLSLNIFSQFLKPLTHWFMIYCPSIQISYFELISHFCLALTFG